MLIASQDNQSYVLAHRANREKRYFCPACRMPVILKKGSVVQPHFAHYSHQECSSFSEAESPEHLKGKLLLYDCFKQAGRRVKLEAYLPDLQQRPDVMVQVEQGRWLCIEFQCSPLSTVDMLKRTNNYQSKGYQVIWVVGEKLKLSRDTMTPLQKMFLFTRKGQVLFAHLDVEDESLFLSGYWRYQARGQLTWKEKKFDLRTLSKIMEVDLFFEEKEDKMIFSDYLYKHKQYMKDRHYRKPALKSVLEKMYEARHSLQTYPHYIYQSIPYEWMIQDHPLTWKYELLEWIKKQDIYQSFRMEDYITFCQSLNLTYYLMPLVEKVYKSLPFLKFMDYLIASGVVSKQESGNLYRVDDLNPYANEQDKRLALLGDSSFG